MDEKSFLEKLGGYRKDRKTWVEGLALAGLLMFGTGQAIRERFDNIFMDYRNEIQVTADIRWNDRITYDGTWENNLFNFFTKVTLKLTEDLKKPFKLEGGVQRIDDTPVHKAVREGFVNMIIHADYLMDAGVLKVIKRSDSFELTNPGILKLPLEDTNLDQVTLVMKMEKESDENVIEISEEKIKQLMPKYSKKKLSKACEILEMISENPNISIDEIIIALDVQIEQLQDIYI